MPAQQGQVVRDQQQRHIVFATQAQQQRNDLLLALAIETGRRLVGQQHTRLAAQGHRNHDALAHAAGKLVRVGAGQARFEPDLPQQVGYLMRDRPRVTLSAQAQHLAQLRGHGTYRIERLHRRLRHPSNAAAAQGAARLFGQAQQFLSRKPDGARVDPRALRQQPQQRVHKGALARAGSAHQARHPTGR